MTVGETASAPPMAPPVEKPVPVQEAALVEDQVRVELPPAMIEAGMAEREAVGAGVTVTVALASAPEQLTEEGVVTVGERASEPPMAPPVEKPVPVQEAALVEDQVRVELPPAMIEAGMAERE